MKRDFILIALLIAAIIGLAVWFMQTYEWRTEEVEVGFQGEAARNRLLAAQRFLEQTGNTVTNVSGIQQVTDMPSSADVVVVPTQRYAFTPERSARFRDWIESGGHLVVTARRLKRKNNLHKDPLLEPLGVKFADTEDEDNKDDDAQFDMPATTNDDSSTAADTDPDNDTVVVKFDDESELLRVRLNSYRSLEVTGDVEPDWYVADDEVVYLVEFRLGRGWLTVVNDFDFMGNDEIRDHDHAAFLWRLLHIDSGRSTVWFIHRDDMPDLSDLIWNNYKPIVIVVALFILAWLWAASRRFGPMLADPMPTRRSLREHIRASGFFIWKVQQRSRLLESTQRAVLAEIEHLHPGWVQLDEPALYRRLAELTDIPVDTIERALQADDIANETNFVEYIDTLETIRKKL